jgi:hypothetical protein
MSEEEQPVAKVTMNQLYMMQLENNRLLTEAVTKLDGYKELPGKVLEVQLAIARLAWIEKVAYAGLLSGVAAIIAMLMQVTP